MTPRLKHVINRLYKPMLGKRQVFTLSRSEAEALPRLATVAVISVTASERPPASLDGFERVLRLSFADVDFLNPELSARAKQKVTNAFTPEQANQILAFVEDLPDSVSSIVAHCEGGYSRSCAIAVGLHKLYGYVVEPERLENANPSVVKMLLEVSKQTKK